MKLAGVACLLAGFETEAQCWIQLEKSVAQDILVKGWENEHPGRKKVMNYGHTCCNGIWKSGNRKTWTVIRGHANLMFSPEDLPMFIHQVGSSNRTTVLFYYSSRFGVFFNVQYYLSISIQHYTDNPWKRAYHICSWISLLGSSLHSMERIFAISFWIIDNNITSEETVFFIHEMG